MTPILLDARNIDTELPKLIDAVSKVDFAGIDIETEDDDRHDGLNRFCGYDPVTRKKSPAKKLAFDIKRAHITGISIYPDGGDTTWYINLYHADVENRVTFEQIRPALDALGEDSCWVAHNAPFELVHFLNCHDYDLDQIICTMQLAVSCYGDDQYSPVKWDMSGLGDMKKLMRPLVQASASWDGDRDTMPGEVSDIIGSVTGKSSRAAFSYNGFARDLAYGHGLKKAVKSFFGVEMATFAETLGDKAHMGQLTGDEVLSYGCDDAYWCMKLFHELLDFLARQNSTVVTTFFEQENPMVRLFAEMWTGGLRVNTEAIESRRASERAAFAQQLRVMKSLLVQLEFEDKPDERLMKREKWYKNYARYRKLVKDFAALPNVDDDLQQALQVRSAVSNAWADELGVPQSTGINLTHYMPVRTILYDLLKAKLIVSKGKIQSDGEARGKIGERLDHPLGQQVVACMAEMASIDTRMKLYLTPYLMLTDPETNRMYPVVTSLLNTRRMAARDPNPMQLAKRGNSTYVRGFFLGDTDEHLIVSIDWSAIELVIIGEASGDAEFAKAYGQLPHGDLHAGAAADLLRVEAPEMSEEMFKSLARYPDMVDFLAEHPMLEASVKRVFTNLKGEGLSPAKAYKYWRTELGKGANFNFWYSGFLATVGERMGWSMDQTGTATKLYTERFWQAENWRVDLINKGKMYGFVELPDGHRRYRYEAKADWQTKWDMKWGAKFDDGYRAAVNEMGRRIHRRAGNQLVNAYVQGTCATLAKRSAIRIRQMIIDKGFDVRLMMPIHDELLFSVHYTQVAEFVELARAIMIDHPDLFPTLALDASPAVGVTFQPWDEEKAPMGQIELYEAPPLDFLPKEVHYGRLNRDQMQEVANYLQEMRLAA
jgi:DNA polymerase I-like protein with 3'-5' exonuclease and polymerase domains